MTFNVLLVDDHQDLIESMAMLMDTENVRIRVAGNLAQARELTDSCSFDLVYLDIKLPDGNGLDFYRQLKAENTAQDVVMMTGFRIEQILPEGGEKALRVVRAFEYDERMEGDLVALAPGESVLLLDHFFELDELFSRVKEGHQRSVQRLSDFDRVTEVARSAADLVLVESSVSLMHAYSLARALRAEACQAPLCIHVNLPEVADARRGKSIEYLGCFLKPFDPTQVIEDLYQRIKTGQMATGDEAAA